MQKEKLLSSVPKLILTLQNNISILLKYNSEQDLCFTCKSIPSIAILSLSDVTYMSTLRLKNMIVILRSVLYYYNVGVYLEQSNSLDLTSEVCSKTLSTFSKVVITTVMLCLPVCGFLVDTWSCLAVDVNNLISVQGHIIIWWGLKNS